MPPTDADNHPKPLLDRRGFERRAFRAAKQTFKRGRPTRSDLFLCPEGTDNGQRLMDTGVLVPAAVRREVDGGRQAVAVAGV